MRWMICFLIILLIPFSIALAPPPPFLEGQITAVEEIGFISPDIGESFFPDEFVRIEVLVIAYEEPERVIIEIDGKEIMESTAEPHSARWSAMGVGDHTFTATAYFTNGSVFQSEETFSVSAQSTTLSESETDGVPGEEGMGVEESLLSLWIVLGIVLFALGCGVFLGKYYAVYHQRSQVEKQAIKYLNDNSGIPMDLLKKNLVLAGWDAQVVERASKKARI